MKHLLPIVCFTLARLAVASAVHAAPSQPNIVILYADDMGVGDVAAANPESKIPTPNLDRLCREGTRFTDAHSSSGICTPSRYALLHGRYHWRKLHGIVQAFDQPILDAERTTLAEMLAADGYRTACIGKWHLGWDWQAVRRPGVEPTKVNGRDVYPPEAFDWAKPIPGGPLDHGFQTYFGDDVPNFPPYAWFEDDRIIEPPTRELVLAGDPAEGHWECRPGPAVEGWDFAAVMPALTKRAVEWIGSQRPGQPFFLYVPFTAPHAPIVPAKEFTGASQAGGYGDYVVQTDHAVGEVLRALEAAGVADDTLVIFTADNGPEGYARDRVKRYGHHSAGPLRGLKRDIYEGGHRVPFIARWPGHVQAGRVEDGLLSQIDLFRTIAGLVGGDIPEGSAEDSLDQRACLLGTGASARDTLIHNTRPTGYAIRRGDWVLIDRNCRASAEQAPAAGKRDATGPSGKPATTELYNLQADLSQQHDKAAAEPQRAADMQRELRRHLDDAAQESAASSRPPNILFIMADDHATQAIGAYGGRLAAIGPSPAIDRLAREGVRLTNCFCTNSICTPSRAVVLTGQHSHKNGVKTLADGLPPERQTLAHEMHRAGYETAVIGKWHLREEPAAFDFYCVLPAQGHYFNPIFLARPEVQPLLAPSMQAEFPGRSAAWPDNWFRAAEPHALHADDAITDLSIKWLANREQKDKPFFLMHHFKGPHDLFENAERYDFLYDDTVIPEPESLRQRGGHGPADGPQYGSSVSKRNPRRNMGRHLHVDAGLSDADYTTAAYQRYLKKYLRTARGVDDNVGRLVAHLKKSGELDNTVIIYTSDQGMMLGEHDYIDKRWMYEESLRMPFIVRYPPAIPADTTCDAIVSNVDFAPTILDFAGEARPDGMQGRSARPLLAGKPAPPDWPDAAYYRYWMHMAHHEVPAHYGIRTADFKLIFFYGLPLDATGAVPTPTPPYWELFDLRKDPQEMHNVYRDPAYAEAVTILKAKLATIKRDVGDDDALSR
jgi:arylsulfatase A-like enzyme